jgi:HPt (histidine-containing phosphotransfer) domain-containing protein
MKEKRTDFEFIDLTYLKDTSMGSEAFLREMIQLFLEEAPKSLRAIEENLEAKNYLQLKHDVHKLKPNLTMMGIHALTDKVVTLEKLAQGNGSHKEMKQLVEEVSEITQGALQELEDYQKDQ